MNEYNYKPKTSSLPKLNLTSLTTHYKSFYSNLSKDKSNSSPYNTFRVYNTKNISTSFFPSDINSNRDKIYPKTAKNIINDRKKKNISKKTRSNITYLTEISKMETDDDYFAMSEIKRIDTTIKKRINKDLIWKKKPDNIYDIYSSKNRTDITNIKNRVKQDLSEVHLNLRKERNKNNYFPLENLESIKDANIVVDRMKKIILQEKTVTEKFNHFNRIDLNTYREQNRDICLKNILINIIKSESNKLKKKENLVSDALKEAKNDFFKDTKTFEKLTKEEMASFRMKEIKLEETIKNNRILIEEIRKRKSELNSLKDEAKKYIKEIILYIQYENFIKKMIAKEKDIISKDEKDLSKYTNLNYGRDFDNIIKNIIKEYYTDNEMNEIILTENINPQMVNNLLKGMESNIINAMEQRDLIIKEINEDKKKYEIILKDLKNKIKDNKNVLDKILKENNLEYNLIAPKQDMQEAAEENEAYIMILNNELSKYVKEKTTIKNANICFNTFYLLHKFQDKLFEIMNELDIITQNNENTDIFKDIIEKLKIENKRKKQNEKKTLNRKLFEEKNKKLQRRMFRYKVRGPITVPPPWALNKTKKKQKIKRDIKTENDEILFYQ